MLPLRTVLLASVIGGALCLSAVGRAEDAKPAAAKPSYPPVALTGMTTRAFQLALRSDTQTLARLSPATLPAFDFVPGGREAERAGDG